MEAKSETCTKKSTSTAMANKSKRAKVVVSSKSTEPVGDELRTVVTRLQSELEAERKTSKQLRREKALQVQQVREAEQNRCAASQKELAGKLHLEKQKELEALRETLRCKHEAEIVKAIKLKELEIKRLQRELQKSQDELKDEIAKRGLSTSARSAFELERAKLLQEIKELTSAKKQLEDALRAATEAEKQKNLEIRQIQENCKLEVAKVEKEAGTEVRKLLEELKSKDHLLAQMDRNQYPDRCNALRQHLASQPVEELLNLSKELEMKEAKTGQDSVAMATPSPTPTTAVTGLQNISWQKKVYELEKQIRNASGLNHAFVEKNKEIATLNNSMEGKIKNLTEENKELNSELTSAKTEMKKMNQVFSANKLDSLTNQLERLRKQIKDQEQVIGVLRYECQEKDRLMKMKLNLNKPKKAVRFLLPGETVPLAPGFDPDDVIGDGRQGDDHFGDDNADSMSVDSTLSDITCQSSQPSSSDTYVMDDDRDMMEHATLLENVEKDYEQLMREHLALEQSYASLQHSYSMIVEGESPPQEWKIERESLNLAIYALEQKVRRCEENEEYLRIKLEQVIEEKEELEFKVFEHEECFEPTVGAESEKPMVEMLEKNQQLESELIILRKKLETYKGGEVSERDVGLQCNRLSVGEEAVEVNERTSEADVSVIVTRPSCLELSAENLSKLGLSTEDAGNSSESDMILSFSTSTSGFDEASSEEEDSGIACNFHQSITSGVECLNVSLEDSDKKLHPAEQESLNETSTSQPFVNIVTNENEIESPGMDAKDEPVLELEATIKNFQTMEVSWKTTVQKLERQLQQSFMRERIIHDQMALVEEEKNRMIKALQGQIDILEDNESRLSETIHVLEDLAIKVETLDGQLEAKEEIAGEVNKEVDELDSKTNNLKEETEELVIAGKVLDQVRLRLASKANVEEINDTLKGDSMTDGREVNTAAVEVATLVNVVETALRNAIVNLENLNRQMGKEVRSGRELDQRIRGMEVETTKNEETEDKSVERNKRRPQPPSTLQVEKTELDGTFTVEDLQSDLRELRGLLIKLKAVIDFDETDAKFKLEDKSELMTLTSEARLRIRLESAIDSPKTEDWVSLTPPGVKIFGEFSDRDNDATEFQMRQKVDELEKDCERLQNMVHEEEQVIRDLHYQNLELRQSEKNYQQLVERMETAEEQMHGKLEEMAEEMVRLQALVKQLETRERMTKSELKKHQENEMELEERLEMTVEEMQNGKQKMQRKIMELENEKKSLVRKTEDQADRIGDLDGLTGSLKLRIRNLEASDSNVRSQVRKMEAELSTAAGYLSELEQQKEALVQNAQDLEREKSKLLFEIADLTMDSNKQGHKISLLNQEIGKLRGSVVNKNEIIACLNGKLDEASSVLESFRLKMAAYENHEMSLMEETNGVLAAVNDKDQRIRELEGELKQTQKREIVTCDQSIQTDSTPLRATIVIEKATTAFRDSVLFLGERHPTVFWEFFSSSLLPLLASNEIVSSAPAVPKEIMQRFIASLQIDLSRDAKVSERENMPLSNGQFKGLTVNGRRKEEEKYWNKVEDLRLLHDVRDAENSTYWSDIESRMGLNTDDLALTIEFKDTVDDTNLEKSLPIDVANGRQPLVQDCSLIPPPLPSSSPPPLCPEPQEQDVEESADEASEINDEDDGAVPLSDAVHPNWTVPYHGSTRKTNATPSPRQHWRPSTLGSRQMPVIKSESHNFRARSVDRDCLPLNQNTFHGSELHRMATGSVESITDSGLDSMRQGASVTAPGDTTYTRKILQIESKSELRDQAIQANDDESFDSVIVLKTQLEQREKELAAKSNEMDRLSQEMRRWQQEAVSVGEERARLSALLGSALKDLKVMRENGVAAEIKSPINTTATRVLKSPLGSPNWGACLGSEKARHASHIPVSIRHSSFTEKDFTSTCQSLTTPRPTSLHSDLSPCSSSSTDGTPNSDTVSLSSYASISQDRKTPSSFLPRPIKETGPNFLSVTAISTRKEADRLFRQSFDTSKNLPGQSTPSPSHSGPESPAGLISHLQAVEPASSRPVGATTF